MRYIILTGSMYLLLIKNNVVEGLFQRAIMQSGAANCFWGTIDGARDIAFEVGQRLGCARETSSLSSHQLVRCLREKTAGEISEAVGYFMVIIFITLFREYYFSKS